MGYQTPTKIVPLKVKPLSPKMFLNPSPEKFTHLPPTDLDSFLTALQLEAKNIIAIYCKSFPHSYQQI